MKKFYPELESLRGIASVLVVMCHMFWLNPFMFIAKNAYIAVDLFFVLSGFVMCHNYINKINDRKSLGKFMLARIARLYPLHIILLLVWLLREYVKYIMESRGVVFGEAAFSVNDLNAFIQNLFLIQSIVNEKATFNGVSWSISVEFYTYIIFALALLTGYIRELACLLIIISLGVLLYYDGSLSVYEGNTIFRCFFGFFIGVITYHLPRKGGYTDMLALLILTLYLFKDKGLFDFIMPPLMGLLILSIVSSDSVTSKILRASPFLWLGKISYSTYMTHALLTTTVSVVLLKFANYDTVIINGYQFVAIPYVYGAIISIAVLILTLIGAHIIHKYIEIPSQLYIKSK